MRCVPQGYRLVTTQWDCRVPRVWNQSEREPPEISGSLETRFAWAYARAAQAMLATSFTTFAAFSTCAINPIWCVRVLRELSSSSEEEEVDADWFCDNTTLAWLSPPNPKRGGRTRTRRRTSTFSRGVTLVSSSTPNEPKLLAF